MRAIPAGVVALIISCCAFGRTYNIETFAGSGPVAAIPGTSAVLAATYSVAVDRTGNVFFADIKNNVVWRLDAATGTLTRVAGSWTAGFSGDNGPATSAQLNEPWGVAVDAAGDLYIADGDNQRIRKVSNGVITTVAGNGTAGFGGDGGPATNAELSGPTGVAVDAGGNLYIADMQNSRVRKVSNGVIVTVAGNGSGLPSGDNGPATNAGLSGPWGVAVDSAGNLYVASGNSIREVSSGVITTVAGNGTPGYSGDNGPATSAQLSIPGGVALDSSGDLYIADTGNGRVRKVSNGVITTVAGNGSIFYNGDSGPATATELSDLQGVAVDSAGNLYIADTYNQRIRRVSSGVITTVAGGGNGGDNGPATSAVLYNPQGVAVDAAGDLYIADPESFGVRKVSGGVITTAAGKGTYGYSGVGGPATSEPLYDPEGVAVDALGDVYIADEAGYIFEVSNGILATVAGDRDSITPPPCSPGFIPYTRSCPALDTYFYAPMGVAVDSAGNLYIAETGSGYPTANGSVLEASDGEVDIIVGTATLGFSGDGGPAASAELNAPSGVAEDSAGNLYIADTGNNRIRKVSNGLIATVAGNGTNGYGGDGGPATSAELSGPTSIALDAAGNLYIADTGNNRIREVTNGVITTIAGNGTAGFGGDGGPAASAELNGPMGVAVDAAGNVYASDSGNDCVRVLTPLPPVPQINAGGVVNLASFTAPVAAGSIAAVLGSLFVNTAADTDLPLDESLQDLSFLFGAGTSAPLFMVSGAQANVQVPWELAGQSTATIAAKLDGQTGAAQTVKLAAFAPGIFAVNGNGSGQGAILDASYSLVDSSNPATAGSTIVLIYCTGLGAVSNQPATGAPAPDGPLAWTTTMPTVTIGGAAATVLFSGLAPGFVGLYQVNALVPAGVVASSVAPVSISMGGVNSNTVTIAVY